MITAAQVRDLQPGDVVELSNDNWHGAVVRGPVHNMERGYLCVGEYAIARPDGQPFTDRHTLIVVSRAPRPLYVNHPRTEPVPGDVVRDADDVLWLRDSWKNWYSPDSTCAGEYQDTGLAQPLRLLVDGSTGEVVP